MSRNNGFLFDDREQFLFGDIGSFQDNFLSESSYDKLKKQRSKERLYFRNKLLPAVSATFLIATSVATASSHSYFPVKDAGTVWEQTDQGLKKRFTDARKFLGLRQADVAAITNLSTSAISKIDQERYGELSLQSRESLSYFIQWFEILKTSYRGKKFIARAAIRANDQLLGDLSPLTFAKRFPGEGIKELIALERKVHG